MKKLLVAILSIVLGAQVALADTCAVKLMPTFTDAQARKICSTLGSLNANLNPAVTDTYDLGTLAFLWDQVWSTNNIIFTYGGNANGNTEDYYKTRASTASGNTILQNNDTIGSIRFLGANGSGYDVAAQIDGFVNGTPGASGDFPGGLRFLTTTDGSATPVVRWQITQTGALSQNNVSGGNLAFNLAGTGIDGSGSGGALLIRQGSGGINFQNSSSATIWNLSDTGNLVSNATNGGDITLSVAGKKFSVKGGGAAATSGQFTCNGVTGVVVATTAASATMAIAFAPATISGVAPIASPYLSAISAATNFTVKCSIAGETSVYNWAMIGVN